MINWGMKLGIGFFCFISITLGQQPNILFLFSDDHTEQAIGVYDYWLKDVANTPNLDKLAGEGMLFKKCYVTNSICGPSRAVIQTGKYSHINGFRQNGNQFNGNQQTFPKILQQNGYETAVIGKWHLGTEPQGFDHYEVMNGQGQYNNPTFKVNNWTQNTTHLGYNSDVVVDRGEEWLTNTRNKSKPFMLMLQFKATHRGWVPPAKYYRLYDTIAIPEHPTLLDDFDYRGSAAFHQDMSIRHSMNRTDVRIGQAGDPRGGDPEGLGNLNTAERNTWEAYENEVKADWAAGGFNWNTKTDDARVQWMYRQYLRAYLGTSVALDDNIGRILKYLDDNNLRQNTVVIYSSDQGFYLGEHGWFDKRFMYEESLKTPFMVRWPGTVTPGSVNKDDIISNIDFAETFLEIAGVTIPNDMQGKSLVPLFQGNTPSDWRESFYYQYWQGFNSTHHVNRHYGVTTGRYKLIYFHDVDEWEFYDLKRDPDEMINQYYITENDSIITALKAELTKLRGDLNVPNEGNVSTPPKITPMQWTTQLPIKGCANPAYVEYDPEVDSPDPTACKTLVSIADRARSELEGLFKITKELIKIDVTGKYILYVYDIRGSMIQAIRGNNPAEIPIKMISQNGVLLYRLQSEKGILHRRGIRI